MTNPLEPDEDVSDADKIAAHYLSIIEAHDKKYREWWDRCEKILKIYTEARRWEGSKTRRFSILWSNISVLQAAVYARQPQPSVARRFKDEDRVARAAGEVIERSLDFTFDDQDLDDVMKLARDDYLLVARGTAWLRYDADFSPIDQGADADDWDEEAGEEIIGERVCIDFVGWRDFGHNVARNWREVRQVWRICYLTKNEGMQRFGNKFANVTMDHKAGDTTSEKDKESGERAKAAIYELWDATRKKVVWLAKGSKLLLEETDPYLNLNGFFPCPPPLYGTLHTNSLMPVPDYVFYQDQVEEIDDLTARIGALLDQLKVAGLYSAAGNDVEQAIIEIAKPGNENVMIPVPNWAGLQDGGGMKGMIEWWPVDQVVTVLQACFETRKQLIEDVYQITGISDIMRGESDPNEKFGTQQMKNQWGSVRVRERQKALAKFARRISRIAAEIIADKFQSKSLLSMSNLKFPTRAEAQQALIAQWQQQVTQMRMQAMQQAQQPPQPNGGMAA